MLQLLATGKAENQFQAVPGSFNFSTPVANGNPLSMDPFQPLSMPGEVGAVAYPPLTVSNLSASLPDFPDDMDPASASANVLPPHTARPRPRPSLSGQQQVWFALVRSRHNITQLNIEPKCIYLCILPGSNSVDTPFEK